MLRILLNWGRSVLVYVAWCVSCIIPKDSRKIVVHAYPNYDDTVRAIVGHIDQVNMNVRLIILTDGVVSVPEWANKKFVHHFAKLSVWGVWFYLRSKYIFFTHGLFSVLKLNSQQVVVNLWHGMPIKAIGLLDKNNRSTPRFNYTIATSRVFAKTVAQSFGVNSKQVIEVGLPRMDILRKEVVNPKLLSLTRKYSKVLVWLPTYRRSVFGDFRVDGDDSLGVYGLTDFDESDFIKVLEELDVLVIVKPHPMSIEAGMPIVYDSDSRLRLINEEWLQRNDLTLYELLSASDGLITDVSSVYVDYKVLARPIIIVFQDEESYLSDRSPVSIDFKDIVTEEVIKDYPALRGTIRRLVGESGTVNDVNSNNLIEFVKSNNTKYIFECIGLS